MFLKFNKRGVRVGFVLIGGLCVSIPLFKCSQVHAAAANLESYTLSPSQALALYGTTIHASYYDGVKFEKCDLNYIGNTFALTSRYGYPSDGTPTYCGAFLAQDTSTGFMNREYFENTPYLIYKWDIETIPSAANVDFSIQLNNSIQIDTFGFESSIFWSRSENSVFPGVNAGLSYYSSSYTLYGASVLDVLTIGQYLARPNVGSEYGIVRTMPEWCMFADGSDPSPAMFTQEVCSTFLGMTAFAGSRESGNDYITVGSQTINIKLERPIGAPSIYYPANASIFRSTPAVYFLIQAPKLYGDYILPSGNAGESVDLSTIEGYLSDGNDSLINISEESTVQTRQLIAILQKLEQIYQAMPDIPDYSNIPMHTTPNLPIDSQAMSDIESALSNTEDIYPDTDELDTNAVQGVSGLFGMIWDALPQKIIFLITLALVGTLVSWVIFRG